MLRQYVLLLSVLSLAGCSGVGPTANVASSTPSVPAPPSSAPPTTTAPPVTTAPPTTPPPTVTTPPPVVTPPPAATPQTIIAWGNSQTQGYGLADCTGNVLNCHPPDAWPAVMAAAKGWTIDNQAVGGTTCADLTKGGSTESIWDLKIDANSVNIYAHFHNDQAEFGGLAYHVAYARNCIEAQTAWLAVPESQKVRAINCEQSGKWTAGPNANPSSTLSTQAGSNLTCTVTGKTVYIATARVYDSTTAIYTVNIDGNLLVDPDTGSTQFNQILDDSNSQAMPNFIRVGGTENTTHTIVYTCIDPGGSGCLVFYAAGVGGTQTPPVYSLSPVPNASWNTSDNFDPATSELYYKAWYSLVTELQGDGLNIIPIDVSNSQVYNPNTQSQPDGIHETSAGHASIGAYAATLK
jgi:hypothetical protein